MQMGRWRSSPLASTGMWIQLPLEHERAVSERFGPPEVSVEGTLKKLWERKTARDSLSTVATSDCLFMNKLMRLEILVLTVCILLV